MPKITTYTKLWLNPSKNKETMKTFHFVSCRGIRMTIMTLYFRIRDHAINFFLNLTRFLPIVYSYQVSTLSELNKKKIFGKLASLIMFSAKHSPLIGCRGNNKWPISKFSIFKDDLYNCLKSRKVW